MLENYQVPLTQSQQLDLIDKLKASMQKTEQLEQTIKSLASENNNLTVLVRNTEKFKDYQKKELVKSKYRVEQVSKAKSDFILQVGKEIELPMKAMKNLSDLILKTELTSEQSEYAKNIVSSSNAVVSAVQDMIHSTEIYSKEIELLNEEYNLREFINDITNSIYLKLPKKNVSFVTKVDPKIPTSLIGDARFLKHILMNILSNAVEFTVKGYINLTITALESDKHNTINLEFIIDDSGSGISKKDYINLFNSYFNEDKSGADEHESSGLGLIASKKLCDLMDGTIHLVSNENEGSTFTVTIPQTVLDDSPIIVVENKDDKRVLLMGKLADAEQIQRKLDYLNIASVIFNKGDNLKEYLKAHKYSHIMFFYEEFCDFVHDNEHILADYPVLAIKDLDLVGQQQTKPFVMSIMKPIVNFKLVDFINNTVGKDFDLEVEEETQESSDIAALIVDDNDVNLFVLEQILNQYDIYPTLCESGEEAVEICQKEKFDIIFMDHMMPGMDGVEASKQIRVTAEINLTTPIIMATANAFDGAREEYLLEGLSDFISKPINIKDLEHVLNVWLPKNKADVKVVVEEEDDEDIEYPPLISILETLDIDGRHAYKAIGQNENVYLSIIDTFIQSAPEILRNLETYSHENNIDAYRIEVHGIKSALANIGAKNLAEVARNLEVSAQKADINFINDYSRGFINDVRILIDGIKETLPLKGESEFDKVALSDTPISVSDFLTYLTALEMLIDDLESNEACNALLEITTNLNQEQSDQYMTKLNQINNSIKNFNYDSAIVKIKQITDELIMQM